MKKYTVEASIGYRAGFATYANLKGFNDKPTDDDIHCAWCHKTITEIGKDKLQKHLEDHDKQR